MAECERMAASVLLPLIMNSCSPFVSVPSRVAQPPFVPSAGASRRKESGVSRPPSSFVESHFLSV